ncbi:response regulator [Synechocystis sp. B12]|nr:response regulator [Synechocystis sp. B12]
MQKSNVIPRRLVLSKDLEGKRVLVVDDNDHARLVMKDLLEQMKFVVETVESGPEALNFLAEADRENHPHSIVFIDWQMPNMDGLEVARRLKAMDLNHQPSIFIVTAYGREELFVKAKSLGIDDVLVKPISPSVLFDSLARVLGDPTPLAQEMRQSSGIGAEDLALGKITAYSRGPHFVGGGQ